MSTIQLFASKGFFRGKRAVSPLVATLMLVIFAVAIGTVTMNWGKTYVESIKTDPSIGQKEQLIVIGIEKINTPLKKLQVDFLLGKISEQEYFVQQQKITGR
ncbi:hypothetical protein HYU13_00075 [Candidatus Woesearchaeota archaeon]|nr:hypothetical protein [Candidatus Woesearchaeota archaeon]